MDRIDKMHLLINALYYIHSLEDPGFPEVLNAPRQVKLLPLVTYEYL